MRFKFKPKNQLVWHNKFLWIPRVIGDELVWLETVDRMEGWREDGFQIDFYWEYRLKAKPDPLDVPQDSHFIGM